MQRILLTGFWLVMLSCALSAQCPAVNIFTRPDSAQNPQRPSMINSFNWLAQKYKLNTTTDTPGNGWELLRRELGFDQNNNPVNPKPENPHIVMYNKYTSVLRVFYARGSSAPFTSARIILLFADGSPAQSSLLDLSEGLMPRDSLFTKDKTFQSPSVFDNRLHQWFYADFPMQYDSCTGTLFLPATNPEINTLCTGNL